MSDTTSPPPGASAGVEAAPLSASDEQVEVAARAICDVWGYEWDVPDGHRCDEFTDCPFLCSEDADDKPTKAMCREAARQALTAATARITALEAAAEAALYRLQEWAPHHVTEDAYGLEPFIGTDAGQAFNELRKAVGITVTRNAQGGYEFARTARSAT